MEDQILYFEEDSIMDKKELNTQETTEKATEETKNEMAPVAEVKFKEHPIQWVKQHPVKAALTGVGMIGGLAFGVGFVHGVFAKFCGRDDGDYNEIETTYADEESPIDENEE
jgi:hypothetical protein